MNRLGALAPAVKGFFFPVEKPAEAPVSPGMPPVTGQEDRFRALLERMRSGPVAEVPEKANEQHYELPPEFLGIILGPRRKYSGCLWEPGTTTLASRANDGSSR